ncbi:MAG: PA14 domain-containing protein [Thermoplasmatota archaeon]
MLLSMHPVLHLLIPGDAAASDNMEQTISPTREISLSGEVDIYDAIDTQVLGKTFDGAGHRLGTYSYIGDINGDGLNDIAITSMEDYSNQSFRGDGRIYVFFGNESGPPQLIDLDHREPDQVIMGDAHYTDDPNEKIRGWTNLGNQMEVGDFNNDNHTDIVLSVPTNICVRESAIVWGREGGLPKNVVVNLSEGYDPGYNITKLTAGTHSRYEIPIYDDPQYDMFNDPIGGFGMNRDITDNFMVAEDLDKDGFDELICGGYVTDDSGYLGCGNLPRVWTVSIYWGSTGNKTLLFEEQGQSYMGRSMDLGDIDGDGQFDLVVGAPYMSKEFQETENYGAAMILFNISKYRFGDYIVDEQFIPMNESYDAIIWGSGNGDGFGNKVMLHDINGDGRDDIFIGAPYADGPSDLTRNSGQIYMFKGRTKEGFPKVMDADNDADSIVYGEQGYQVGPPEVMGDSLGTRFGIGDLDANGELEFIAGLPLRDLPEKEGRQRDRAGLVMVYPLKDLFNDQVRVVQISSSQGDFVLHGYDIGDNLGYQLLVEDVDNDGMDDIFLTAPMADGPDNNRPRCGEAYIILGKGLLIGELGLSGPTVNDNNDVFLGDGEITIDLPYRYTGGADRISRGKLVIDPEGMDLEMAFSRDGYQLNDNLLGSLLSEDVELQWSGSQEKGKVGITLEPGWDLVSNEWLDVKVGFQTESNETITRTFEDALILRNDVFMSKGAKIYHDDIEVIRPGRWFSPGEELGVDLPELRYAHDSSRTVEEGPFTVELLKEGGTVMDSIEYDNGTRLKTVLGDIPFYDLSLRLTAGREEDWEHGSPDTGAVREARRIQIDGDSPLSPEGLRIGSVSGVGNFSKTGEFLVEWKDALGKKGDSNGSGVRHYEIRYGGTSVVPKAPGGLAGTYYQDTDLITAAMERVDSSIDFLDWGDWGPDPSLLPSDHFSVRWHGYVELTGNHAQYIRFSGRGMVKVIVNGSLTLDWTDLGGTPRIGPYEETGEELLPIEVYYRQESGSSGIRMEYLNSLGSYQLLKDQQLYSPSNNTNMEGDNSGTMLVSVASVDWTDKDSPPITATGITDDTGPMIMFRDMLTWYSDTNVSIRASMDDGDPKTSSGTDATSILYRMKRDGEDWSEWKDDDLEVLDTRGPLDIVIEPDLEEDWEGTVQLLARDRVGNPSYSDIFWFGVDTDPPSLEPLEPVPGSNITSDRVRLLISASDIGGSGVNRSGVMFRYSTVGDQWSQWMDMNVEEGGSSGGRITAYTYLSEIYGKIRYQFRVSDMVENIFVSDVYEINVSRPEVDLPPVAVISQPEEGQVFDHGTLIYLSAEGTNDDRTGMDELSFTWISSIDGLLGTGMETEAVLSSGSHEIRLYVFDGTPGNNVSALVNITVKEKENGHGVPDDDDDLAEEGDRGLSLWIILLVLAVALIFMAAAVILKKRYDTVPSRQPFQSEPEGNEEE